MKRDMDLIRMILLVVESAPPRKIPLIEGYTAEQIGHHVYLMIQAGLIEGAEVTSHQDQYDIAIPTQLTWQGHDFLDACRNESVWNKAKERLKSIGGDVPLAVIQSLLVDIIRKQGLFIISSG